MTADLNNGENSLHIAFAIAASQHNLPQQQDKVMISVFILLNRTKFMQILAKHIYGQSHESFQT